MGTGDDPSLVYRGCVEVCAVDRSFFPGATFEPSDMQAETQIAMCELHGVVTELQHRPDGGCCLPSHFHDEYQILASEHQFIEYCSWRDCGAVNSKNLKDA